MGSKSASKDIMLKAKVPVTPGYHGEDQSIDTLQREADKMGYPLICKAVMGGGNIFASALGAFASLSFLSDGLLLAAWVYVASSYSPFGVSSLVTLSTIAYTI